MFRMNHDLMEPLNLEIVKPHAQYQENVEEQELENDEPKTILDLEQFPQIPISVSIPAYTYHHQWMKLSYDTPQNSYTSSYDYPYPVYTTPPPIPSTYYSCPSTIPTTIPTKSSYDHDICVDALPKDSTSNNFSDNSNSSSNIQIMTEEEMWRSRALQLERGSTKIS